MKKRLLCGLMGALMVFSLTACGTNNKNVDVKNETTKAATSTVIDVKYSDYLTIEQYKDLEIEIDKELLKVEDSDIEKEVQRWLDYSSEKIQVTDRVTEDGDTINFDFSGLLDGVAFAGGTATDYTYTIGGNFIESLDRQLIGLEIGKSYDLPCTFPQDYGSEELNGKDVIFVVTVNYIEESLNPEYNDAFVAANSEAYFGEALKTVDEVEKYLREYLEESNLEAYNNVVYQKVAYHILDNNDFSKIPQSVYDETIATMKSNAQAEFEQTGSEYNAKTFEEFITGVYGYESMDAFEKDVADYAEQYIQEQALVSVIAEKENIVVTDKEITEYLTQLATQYGYASADALKAQYGSALESDVRYTLLQEKVMDFLVNNQKIK